MQLNGPFAESDTNIYERESLILAQGCISPTYVTMPKLLTMAPAFAARSL